MTDSKLVILFLSPNLRQFGLNLLLEYFNKLEVAFDKILLPLDFRDNTLLGF